MKTLAKKVKVLNVNNFGKQLGQIKPLFSIDEQDRYSLISESRYPNNGFITVYNYEILTEDITEDYFYIKADFFINDVDNPNNEDPNFSLKKITYNSGIRHHFENAFALDFLPIYKKNFGVNSWKLIDEEGIENDIFFLENEDNEIFGPFERNGIQLKAVRLNELKEGKEYNLNFEDFLEQYTEHEGEIILKYKVEDIKDKILKVSEEEKYLKSFQDIINKRNCKLLILTTKNQILDWVFDKMEGIVPELNGFKEAVLTVSTKHKTEIEELKWNQFTDLLKNKELDDSNISKVIEVINEKGILNVSDEQLKLAKEDFQKERDRLENEIQSKGSEIIELKNEITFLKNDEHTEVSNESGSIDFNYYPDLKEALSSDENIKKTIETLRYNDDINKLKAKKELLNEDLHKLRETNSELKKSKEDIISGFNQQKHNLTSELAKAKIYTDLLNGIGITHDQFKEDKLPIITPNIIANQNTSAEEYIFEIQEKLKKQNRELTFNDVVNLVLTVNLSFLTILAGAPGVGKTSLIDKLSKAYGLNESFGYLEIPCAKGWTSAKDLIGFYNPLTQKFQESKTKLKTALVNSSNFKNSPYLILLDEANLSPMEHYWSDFIKLADFEYPRKIKISENEILEFGQGLRFVSTINHDHTTETLSGRLLDRASIIQIEKSTTIDNNFNNLTEVISDVAIHDYYTTQNLFIESDRWKREAKKIIDKLDNIISKLESNYSSIIVSPRKRNAIIKYCSIGTGLLKGNDFAALDYAIAQHLLPIINVRGDVHLASLESIKDLLSEVGMTKSKNLVNKIIERGKEFKHFKYIYY